jgi:hypothetical protein
LTPGSSRKKVKEFNNVPQGVFMTFEPQANFYSRAAEVISSRAQPLTSNPEG